MPQHNGISVWLRGADGNKFGEYATNTGPQKVQCQRVLMAASGVPVQVRIRIEENFDWLDCNAVLVTVHCDSSVAHSSPYEALSWLMTQQDIGKNLTLGGILQRRALPGGKFAGNFFLMPTTATSDTCGYGLYASLLTADDHRRSNC